MAKGMKDSKIGPSVEFDMTQKKRAQHDYTYDKNEQSPSKEKEKRGGHIEYIAKKLHGKDPYCASHKL
jgi:hypothetical protein